LSSVVSFSATSVAFVPSASGAGVLSSSFLASVSSLAGSSASFGESSFVFSAVSSVGFSSLSNDCAGACSGTGLASAVGFSFSSPFSLACRAKFQNFTQKSDEWIC